MGSPTIKRETMDKIAHFLAIHEIGTGTPASAETIKNIETQLSITLNSQYVDFVKMFGGTFAGIAIHFDENSDEIGKETVIQLTEWFRESVCDEKYHDCLVFSDDGAGNAIFLNSDGNVMIYYHDSGEVEKLYESFQSMFDAMKWQGFPPACAATNSAGMMRQP